MEVKIKQNYNTLKPISQGKNGKIYDHITDNKILKIVTLNKIS